MRRSSSGKQLLHTQLGLRGGLTEVNREFLAAAEAEDKTAKH